MSLDELLGDYTDFTDERTNRLSLSDQDDDGSLFSLGKGDLFDEIKRVERIPSLLDEPCSSTAVLLENAEGDDLQVSEVFAGQGESSGSGRKTCDHGLTEWSNYAVFGVGDDEVCRQEPGHIMYSSDEEEEAEVISQIQELSVQNDQQENEQVIALLNENVGQSQVQNDQDGKETLDRLVVPSVVISDGQVSKESTPTVTVILNVPKKVKKKRSKQQKSCSGSRDSQLCCISHVINPETNGKVCEEPINVGNSIQIPRDKWAAAFNEDDIGGCARHLFKAMYTPEQIETCTYSGKNNTQKLCRIRTEAIFDIVAWMRSNKKEYPYSFTNCPDNFNILSAGKLTDDEKSFIIKKVFVEDRSQQRMKQDLQKQKEADELMETDAPPKAKKSRKF